MSLPDESNEKLSKMATEKREGRGGKEMIKIHELLYTLDTLKHLKRTGWVHFDVPEPETVAGHMYRMAVLSMALAAEYGNCGAAGFDAYKCLRMTLVHDIGEAIVGDITPRCGVSDAEKHRIEADALDQIGAMVPPAIGRDWRQLWDEYEAAESADAKLVKQLDKFDMLAQAWAYEQRFPHLKLDEFFDSTTGAFHSEPFLGWAQEIRQKRAATLAKNCQKSDESRK